MGRMRAVVLAACLPLPLLAGQAAKAPVAEPAPPVSLLLKDRQSQVSPARRGGTHTGGGTIDVQQPAPETVVITLAGAAVATDHPCGSSATMAFELEQCFDIVFDKPGLKSAKLTLEARVIGLLRGGRKGSASAAGACAAVSCGEAVLVSVCTSDRAVAGGESLSVNDRTGPVGASVGAGPYTLHARWLLAATHPKALLGKSASAEFAPEPALDPLWVGGPRDPFHGAGKKDFGFQVTLRVAEEPPADPAR
jgi:hypothetical protein